MLYLNENDYQVILKHAIDGLPNEACGLLAGVLSGEEKHIKKVYTLTNVDASNEHFSIDPAEQLDAVKDMRKNGLVMLGNFHSHPESPSRPSEEDKRLAFDTKVDYLILSLQDREQPVLKAFLIDRDKNVTIEPITILK